MKLFEKIRILRKARGLSQEQLGYSLSRVNKDGISRQTISDWENGNFEPKLENIRDLAEVLDVSFDVLLDETIDLDDDKVLQAVLNNDTGKLQKIKNRNKHNEEVRQLRVRDIILFILTGYMIISSLSSIISYGLQLLSATSSADGWSLALEIGLGTVVFVLSAIAFALLIVDIVRRRNPKATIILMIVTICLSIAFTLWAGISISVNVSKAMKDERHGPISAAEAKFIAQLILSYTNALIKDICFLILTCMCLTVFNPDRKPKQVEEKPLVENTQN